MEVSQKYHKIPIFVFFLFRKIGAKVESVKVTPSKVHLEQGIQQKMWKKKIYTSKKKDS